MRLVGLRHVRGDRWCGRPARTAPMGGDARPAVEDLDGGGGEADIDDLMDERERRGIVMTVQLVKMVIDIGARDLPFPVDKRRRGQRASTGRSRRSNSSRRLA